MVTIVLKLVEMVGKEAVVLVAEVVAKVAARRSTTLCDLVLILCSIL